VEIRSATPDDVDPVAAIWHDGWHEAHAHLLPAELTRLRTLESFRDRIVAALSRVRVAGAVGAPLGFCLVKQDELYQLYLSASARGSGVAAALMTDAEARLAEDEVETAWLACAIGNERAARFYRKCGWQLAGTVVNQVETSAGDFPLEVWRFEKRLAPR
jgi:ribosomal protein S18 acetylase RimI-like enzyme